MRIFENIVNYLKKIFSKQKQLNSGEEKQKIPNKEELSFMDTLQKDSKKYFNKKSILNEINKNPDLINTLSYSRLVQLNEIYEEKINELEKRISQVL